MTESLDGPLRPPAKLREPGRASRGPVSCDSTRVNQAMAIARQKTRQRELREARALIRRVQRGDRRAFELLYSRLRGPRLPFLSSPDGRRPDRRGARRAHVCPRARGPPRGRLRHARRARVPAGDGTFARLRAQRRARGRARTVGRRGRRRQPAPLAAGARSAGPARPRGPSRRRDRPCARRPGAGCSGTRRHGASAPAWRASAARDRRSLPGPAARAVGLCRRHAGSRGARRARPSRHRLRELPRRTVRPARGRVALRDAARARAARRSRIAHRHCARRGRPAGARNRGSRARRRRWPQDGGGRGDGRARARGRRRHDRGRRRRRWRGQTGPGSGVAPAPGTAERAGVRLRPWRSVPSACL